MDNSETIGFLGLILAQILPLALGYSWLRLIWQESHVAARIGYGYMLGICFTSLLLYIWGRFGIPFQFAPIILLLAVLAMVPLFFHTRKSIPLNKPSYGEKPNLWQQVFWGLLLFALLVRFGGLLWEEMLRPLYPWDAWMNWAPKAKVWFESGRLAPFVHQAQWAQESLAQGAYTLGNPKAVDYPPLVPLIQLWSALGLGQWRDNWINLPWFACALAFACAFYGQLRMQEVSPLYAILAVFLLFSMPYLNAHVALAGYAEIWLASFYAAALMALINWSTTNSRIQLVLVIVLSIACVFTKLPGIVWAATLAVGIVYGLLPSLLRNLLFFSLGIFVVLLLLGMSINLDLPNGRNIVLSLHEIDIPILGRHVIEYHPAGKYFVINDFIRDNWHLLVWLLLTMPLVFYKYYDVKYLLPGLVVLASGFIFILVVFFFTEHYSAARNSTTINRAGFHILPATFYLFVLALALKISSQAHKNKPKRELHVQQ